MSVLDRVESYREQMLRTVSDLIRIPALSPANGGRGEMKKARALVKVLKRMDLDFEWHNAADSAADSGERPNIVVRVQGKTDRNLWIITHLDVVPPGDLSAWKTDPFKPVLKKDRLYGRGSEDNGQSLVASIYALKSVIDEQGAPGLNVNLAFVADEETGSKYGISYLIREGLFTAHDLILVPDGGNEYGSLIEVSEKSILWLRFHVEGEQCHASIPSRGKNAHKAGIDLAHRLMYALPRAFEARDETFNVPYSTFEPTKKEANVPNVNTVPGDDIFYFDCRVLPVYTLDDVLDYVAIYARQVEMEHGVKVKVESVMKDQAAPSTPPDHPLVKGLMKAVKEVYGIDAMPGGIGGGTCAAIFRRAGFQAVVWSRIDETCHAPNEYLKVDNLVGDAKVFALLMK